MLIYTCFKEAQKKNQRLYLTICSADIHVLKKLTKQVLMYYHYFCGWKNVFQRVILRYATTHNHPQLSTTIYNHPKPLINVHHHSKLPTTTHTGYTRVCNHPQQSTTTHNHPQPPQKNTRHNHPQPSNTTHNDLKVTQKRQNLSQTVILMHLLILMLILKQTLTLIVTWDNGICVCLCVYIL